MKQPKKKGHEKIINEAEEEELTADEPEVGSDWRASAGNYFFRKKFHCKKNLPPPILLSFEFQKRILQFHWAPYVSWYQTESSAAVSSGPPAAPPAPAAAAFASSTSSSSGGVRSESSPCWAIDSAPLHVPIVISSLLVATPPNGRQSGSREGERGKRNWTLIPSECGCAKMWVDLPLVFLRPTSAVISRGFVPRRGFAALRSPLRCTSGRGRPRRRSSPCATGSATWRRTSATSSTVEAAWIGSASPPGTSGTSRRTPFRPIRAPAGTSTTSTSADLFVTN